MKRTRFTDEQIIGILGEHEAGAKCADLCRKHGMSEGTFYNWKAKFGGMTVSEAKRLKALEDENARLKKLLAEQMLDLAAMKDLVSKKWYCRYKLPDPDVDSTPFIKLFTLFDKYDIDLSARRTQCCAVGCGTWPTSAGGSVTGACSFCCAARVSLRGSTVSIGSTARKD